MAAPSKHNPGDAAKAYRLRAMVKRGQTLKPIDVLWLADYDHHHPNDHAAAGRASGAARGAHARSRKGRKIDLHVEEAEEHEASADSPAALAAAAALQSKAEGERLDTLTVNALKILQEAVSTYRKLCASVTDMLATYQTAHLETLAAVRTHYLARTEAESAAMEAERSALNAGDPAKEMMLIALMKHFGVDVPAGVDPGAFFKAQRDAARQQAAANGAKPAPPAGR